MNGDLRRYRAHCDVIVMVWQQHLQTKRYVLWLYWLGRLGHLVEDPVAMKHDDYVNILSQHLLVSAQCVFRQTQPKYRITQSTTYRGPYTHLIWTSSKLCGDGMKKLNANPPEML